MRVAMLVRPEAPTQPRTLALMDKEARVEVKELPRCQAQRVTRYCGNWEAGNPDKTCSMRARYRIDGVDLCGRHAGEVALATLLTGDVK